MKTKKPRKKYNPNARRASYSVVKLAIGKAMKTPTDDVDMMDKPDADFQALKRGECDTDGFNRLVEIVVAVFIAGRLLQERGVGETKTIGWTYKSIGQEGSLALQEISVRYRDTKRFVGTGDQLRMIGDALAAMRNIIPVLTRGELIIVLEEAANLIEEGERDAKKLRAANLIPQQSAADAA